MSNLNQKIIEREIRKLSELKTFNHQRYAEVVGMLINMNLDDGNFVKYMDQLKDIRGKYRREII